MPEIFDRDGRSLGYVYDKDNIDLSDGSSHKEESAIEKLFYMFLSQVVFVLSFVIAPYYVLTYLGVDLGEITVSRVILFTIFVEAGIVSFWSFFVVLDVILRLDFDRCTGTLFVFIFSTLVFVTLGLFIPAGDWLFPKFEALFVELLNLLIKLIF